MKLFLSIRSLNIGGAERQFIELVKHIDKSKFDVTVCTMYGGVQEDVVKEIPNIKYYNLQKNGRYDFYRFYKNYSKLLNEVNPDVIYSFLGEMNLFSLWCKPMHSRIIWGFRASNMDLKKYGVVPQIVFWLQKKFSSRVDKIIANSKSSIEFHKRQGFDMSCSTVVANGIDTHRFQKYEKQRAVFREKYNLSKDDIAIGIVARIDYMKGYTVFSKAAKKLLENYENIYFFSVGSGDARIKKECEIIMQDSDRFFWLGSKNSVEDYYSGFDVCVSSSLYGEGFSNSIAEAMSCECPCVVTDVGDSAFIVGDYGVVVNAGSVEELYNGIAKIITRDLQALGRESRKKIQNDFSVSKMVGKTEDEILKCVE